MTDSLELTCERCGKTTEYVPPVWPDSWSGTDSETPTHGDGPTCPGCQYAEWHPHCTSVRTQFGYGVLVETDVLKRDGHLVLTEEDEPPLIIWSLGELKSLDLGWCDYLDLDHAYVDEDKWPTAWTCPKCGGTRFDFVHRDYQGSNLKGATFGAELIDEDDQP